MNITNVKKYTLLILPLFLLLCLLTGCTAEENDVNAQTDGITDAPETAAPEKELALIRDGKCLFTVVRPYECTDAEKQAAMELREAFVDACGIHMDISDDFARPGEEDHAGDVNKILVGRTNYPASKEIYAQLKYNDYRVEMTDSYIIVAACSTEGFREALKWIRENVFTGFVMGENGKAKELTVKQMSVVKDTSGNYAVSSFNMLGAEISEYSIVYADKSLADAAAKAAEMIALKTGYMLNTCQDDKQKPGEREILIGQTNREESSGVTDPGYLHYTVKAVGTKLVVKAGGEHTLGRLLENIFDIFPAKKGDVTVSEGYELSGDLLDDPLEYGAPAGSELRVMSVNILAEYETWGNTIPVSRRKEVFFSALDVYRPDVIGLQEVSPAWFSCIPEYSGFSDWELLKFADPHQTNMSVFSTIMYRKDKFELVDAGSEYYSLYNNNKCRCVTWALLKDMKTGKTFCFVSTHWDGQDSENTMRQVAEMTEFCSGMAAKGFPVITTGDFNSNEISKAFPRLLADCNMQDCKFTAKKLLNSIGSWHELALAVPSTYSCDHVTATKDVTVHQFETLIYNEQIYGSDHSWLVSDVSLN